MGTIFIGIDIGKKSHAWCMVSSHLLKQHKRYQKCPQGTIKNERAGFDLLLARVRAEAGNTSTIHVLVEHTGHYGYNLEQFLQEQSGVRVYRVLAAKRYGRDKTDRKDAQALSIRLYNQIGLRAPVTDESERVTPLRSPVAKAAQLKPLVHRRVELKREIVRCQNRLTSIADQLFPELTQIFVDPNGPSALNLREKFPTARSIAEASLKELTATRTWTRPSNADFLRLQELAKTTVGLKAGARAGSLLIEQAQLITEMRVLLTQEHFLDEQIEEALTGSREAQILRSFPGIGTTLAAQILASVGNIRNFATLARFRSYCGWAPRQSATGTTYDSTRTDRAGNRLAKLAMRQAAVSAISHSERWCALHTRLMAGPHASGAMGRVTGQLVGVIYLLLKADAELVARAGDGPLPPPVLYDPHR